MAVYKERDAVRIILLKTLDGGTTWIPVEDPTLGGGTGMTQEEIQDMLATFIVAGSNITTTYDDVGNTLTIAVSNIYAAAQTLNAQTGTTYTHVLGDSGKMVTLNNAGAITFTVDTNANVATPVGTRIDLAQLGAGQVTVAGAGGVTVSATPGLKLRATNSGATLFKTGTNTWLLFGDLSA